MHRGLALLLLFWISVWFGVGSLAKAEALSRVNEVEHAKLHWSSQPHHHHSDGTVIQDDSDESLGHLLIDACVDADAACQDPTLAFVHTDAAAPADAEERAHPWPALDGLKRPPRPAV